MGLKGDKGLKCIRVQDEFVRGELLESGRQRLLHGSIDP